MEKNILAYLLIFFVYYSCNNKVVNSDYGKISNEVLYHQENKAIKDSVLIISLYRKTSNYRLYWVSLQKKPYKLPFEFRKCYEFVDDNTIFNNKCKLNSNDYNLLLKKELIVFSESKGIDDSLEGFMFIFNNKNEFKETDLAIFFEKLEMNSPPKKMSFAEEDLVFDRTSIYFMEQ